MWVTHVVFLWPKIRSYNKILTAKTQRCKEREGRIIASQSFSLRLCGEILFCLEASKPSQPPRFGAGTVPAT
jgi:hypothetical protein